MGTKKEEKERDPYAFPLFKGATRVPTYFGVPMWPLILMLMVVASVAMLVNLLWWLSAPFIWWFMAQITKSDDKAFRVIGLYIDTKLRNRHKSFWKASSYSPVKYKRSYQQQKKG